MNATSRNIPAERILPGVGRQLVNSFNSGGRFVRQVAYRGTVRQARAYALLQQMHDTDPAFPTVLAALRDTK